MNPCHKTVVIEGQVSLSVPIDGYSSLNTTIDGQGNAIFVTKASDADYYDGDYVITPRVDEQILQTREKLMADNVTVKEIPYYETSNINGTTIYIANSLEG